VLLAVAALVGATCAASSSLATVTSARPAASVARSVPSPARDLDEPGCLALGDSIAFGYRPASVTSATDYLNPADFTGYPSDVATALGLHLVNASWPGETTSSIIAPCPTCSYHPQ